MRGLEWTLNNHKRTTSKAMSQRRILVRTTNKAMDRRRILVLIVVVAVTMTVALLLATYGRNGDVAESATPDYGCGSR